MRHLIDPLDDHVPAACAAGSYDPFIRPDHRGKRKSRPMGRVVHKRKPRLARVQWVEVVE